MKTTGIVRQIDEAGRLVLPKELRRIYDLLGPESEVEIFTDENTIVLKKYAPRCVFCGAEDDIVEFKGTKVCKNCIKALDKQI